jgi:hypothetical protein
MVMDEYGNGQVVQQSLFERNTDWHMEAALTHLVAANEDTWNLVHVIVVDKELNEIRVLQSWFPGVRILICIFHVIKYLTKAADKVEFGRLSKDDNGTMCSLIKNLVYSDSTDAYVANMIALKDFCTLARFLGFYEYFLKNWTHAKKCG